MHFVWVSMLIRIQQVKSVKKDFDCKPSCHMVIVLDIPVVNRYIQNPAFSACTMGLGHEIA